MLDDCMMVSRQLLLCGNFSHCVLSLELAVLPMQPGI